MCSIIFPLLGVTFLASCRTTQVRGDNHCAAISDVRSISSAFNSTNLARVKVEGNPGLQIRNSVTTLSQIGLLKDDVILRTDGFQIESIEETQAWIHQRENGKSIMDIERGGKLHFLEIGATEACFLVVGPVKVPEYYKNRKADYSVIRKEFPQNTTIPVEGNEAEQAALDEQNKRLLQIEELLRAGKATQAQVTEYISWCKRRTDDHLELVQYVLKMRFIAKPDLRQQYWNVRLRNRRILKKDLEEIHSRGRAGESVSIQVFGQSFVSCRVAGGETGP